MMNQGDRPTASQRTCRTLIRVVEVPEDSDSSFFSVVLPGWDTREFISLPFSIVPKEQRENIKPKFRFHANVNIGALLKEDLKFTDFEWE